MPISSIDTLNAAPTQRITIDKTASAGTFALKQKFSMLFTAGTPGAASSTVGAYTNNTTGIVPVAGFPGFPAIRPFVSGGIGKLTRVEFHNSVAGRLYLEDNLFVAGPFSAATTYNLTSQPSYSGRLPGGSYEGTELWVLSSAVSTGIPTVTITYTNQSGVTGKTTGAYSLGATVAANHMYRIPLATGDTGVQKIESVQTTVTTSCQLFVVIQRRLWAGRCAIPYVGDVHDVLKTGGVQIYETSALSISNVSDLGFTGLASLAIDIANAA